MALDSVNPPLYADPVPLHAEDHAQWHLVPTGLEYAAGEAALPLMLEEFSAAARHYPIVFAGDAGMPMVLTGLTRRNGFIAGGRWREGHYLPAYLRRYPFLLMDIEATDTMPARSLLAIDRAAPQVQASATEEGVPLFVDGKPGAVVEQALRFCEEFTAAHAATKAWVQALQEKELLVPRHVEARLADGEVRSVTGFSVIDVERFAGLDAATVVDWHRKGWLGAVHFHVASLQGLQRLLDEEA